MRRLLLVIMFALGANAAHADGTAYAGGGISKSKISDIASQGTNFADIDTTSWKVFAGVRPISPFAIEADYLDLGSDAGTHAKAFAAYRVGFLPIPVPFLDLYGKAGLSRVKINGSSPVTSFSTSGTDFAWGGGAGVHVGNFGARLEYERFIVPSASPANVVSLDVYLNIF